MERTVTQVIEVDRHAERIAKLARQIERFPAQDLPPRVITAVVVRPTQIAQDDADLPLVPYRASDRERLFLHGDGAILIALARSDETEIVEATRDPLLVAGGTVSFQRLAKETIGLVEFALIAGHDAKSAQREGR